jgi:hypothetical protein
MSPELPHGVAARRTEGRHVGAERWQRLGLLLLGIPQTASGLWAVLAPRDWYDTFPGEGREWLPAFGPYNEHFAVDAGVGILAAGVLALAAAAILERRVVQVAMVGYLAWSVPHAIWHLTALDALDTSDNVINVTTLGITVILPLVLLLTAGRLPREAHGRAPA